MRYPPQYPQPESLIPQTHTLTFQPIPAPLVPPRNPNSHLSPPRTSQSGPLQVNPTRLSCLVYDHSQTEGERGENSGSWAIDETRSSKVCRHPRNLCEFKTYASDIPSTSAHSESSCCTLYCAEKCRCSVCSCSSTGSQQPGGFCQPFCLHCSHGRVQMSNLGFRAKPEGYVRVSVSRSRCCIA